MKCSELADALEHLEGMYRLDARDTPQPFSNFKLLLRSVPSLTISNLSKKLDGLIKSQPTPEAISAEGISALCETIIAFLQLTGKPGAIREMQLLSVSIDKLRAINPEDLSPPANLGRRQQRAQNSGAVRLDLVQAHLRLLEDALGDDVGFTSAFRALETDPKLTTVEFVALAKQFSFAATKSKSAALKKIWARHQALMTSRAKAAATAGRIAG